MLVRYSALVSVLLASGVSLLHGATIYRESVSGDFSNSGLSPTQVTVGLGSNQIFGTTGNAGSGIDRDYFTITIPANEALTGITVLAGTTSGGATSFIGLQAGPQVTLPTNASTAAGLLGWWHYGPSDVGSDILSKIAIPVNGAIGFTTPLGPGQYSFWVQDFNAGAFNYGFDLAVAAAAATPEPATWGLLVAGLCVAIRRRRTT